MMQYTMLWGGEYVKNINVQDKTWGVGTTYHKWLIANTETQGRTGYLSIGHMSKHMLIGGINALPYSSHML